MSELVPEVRQAEALLETADKQWSHRPSKLRMWHLAQSELSKSGIDDINVLPGDVIFQVSLRLLRATYSAC